MLRAHGPNGYSRHETSTRRTRFLAACVDADMPEATRLAGTIEKWWPEIEGFLELGKTNARTEGYNRVIKQIKRVACGFRNQGNYERRIMLHSAAHRARLSRVSWNLSGGPPPDTAVEVGVGHPPRHHQEGDHRDTCLQ